MTHTQKICSTLFLVLLAGCAGAPPAPTVLPYREPEPHHRPPHKKPHIRHPREKTQEGRKRRLPAGASHAPAQSARGAPHATSSGPDAKPRAPARPQRPVLLYANDAALAAQVNGALHQDPSLQGAHIVVHAREGNIWLTGHVNNNAQKARAVGIAGNITGVKMVNDDLKAAHP